MPATYTYNDGIQDASREIADALDKADGDPVFRMSLLLEVIGRLERLKRPSRQRRRAPAPIPQQQTSGSEIPNNCPQSTTQEKT